MQARLSKAYKDFVKAVESFANSSAGIAPDSKREENATSLPVPDYAYPCDNYINSFLGNKITQQALRRIANKYYGEQIKEIVRNEPVLTATNFPRLYANYMDCCRTLGIARPPKLYVTSRLTGINALSVEVEKEPIILLSHMSVAVLSDAEQKFVLGHEAGHILFGHLVAHTVQGLLQDLNSHAELLGPIFTDIIDVPLNQWYQASEFTADRAGLICCGSLEVSKVVFDRIGLNKTNSAYEQYLELSTPHPLLQTRWSKMLAYDKENNYIMYQYD